VKIDGERLFRKRRTRRGEAEGGRGRIPFRGGGKSPPTGKWELLQKSKTTRREIRRNPNHHGKERTSHRTVNTF